MAFWKLSTFTWTSPGGGSLPAVEDTLNITDTNLAAQGFKTVWIEDLEIIFGNNASDIVDLKNSVKTVASTVSKFNQALLSVSAMTGQRNALMAMQISSQTQTNNFFKNASKEDPAKPPVYEQLRKMILDSTILMETAKTNGLVLNQINNLIGNVKDFAASALAPYTSVIQNYVDDILPIVVELDPPSSPEDIAQKAANLAGLPYPGT
jgi:hypothetical protein